MTTSTVPGGRGACLMSGVCDFVCAFASPDLFRALVLLAGASGDRGERAAS